VKLVVCETPDQIQDAQRLRYEVFCLEKGWVDAAAFEDGLETDELDDGAVHFLVLADDDTPLGTSRLLLGASQRLPALGYLDIRPLGIDASTVVEVSRLAARRDSRAHGLAVFLAMTQVMWEWSMAHDMNAWVSVADVSVFALMKRVGMPILAKGHRTDYLGSTCIPSCVDMHGTGEVLSKRGFDAREVQVDCA
jgi:N-acyl-L-homoserine lactone synthetase